MEMIKVPKMKFELMQREIVSLRNSSIYKRLLGFEKNILNKRYSRKDLGF